MKLSRNCICWSVIGFGLLALACLNGVWTVQKESKHHSGSTGSASQELGSKIREVKQGGLSSYSSGGDHAVYFNENPNDLTAVNELPRRQSHFTQEDRKMIRQQQAERARASEAAGDESTSPQKNMSLAELRLKAESANTAQVTRYPAVMAGMSTDQGMSALQQHKLEGLANQFIQDVGGVNQDPNDPEYLKRWSQAVPDSDAQYKLWFGSVAYVQRQVQAAQTPNEVK